jgi:hypothetical protein
MSLILVMVESYSQHLNLVQIQILSPLLQRWTCLSPGLAVRRREELSHLVEILLELLLEEASLLFSCERTGARARAGRRRRER